MALIRFNKPPATFDPKQYGAYGREAESSWRKARDAWNRYTQMGFDESTVFFKPENSPNDSAQKAFAIQNYDDFLKAGFNPSQVSQKDAQDFFAISDKVDVFVPGTGPESTLSRAYRGQIVGIKSDPNRIYYSDPQRGLVPYYGIVKNRPSYEIESEAAATLQQVNTENKQPVVVPPSPTDLGTVYTPDGTTAPTQLSRVIGNRDSTSGEAPKSVQDAVAAIVGAASKDPNFASQPITDETVDKYLQQARAEQGPYFDQLFNQAKSDFLLSLQRTQEDLATQERSLLPQYQQQLGQIAEGAAQTGKTFSLSRQREEQSVTDATNQALQAAQKQALRQAQNAGIEAERTLGSKNLPQGLSGFTVAGTQAQRNLPGVYGAFNTQAPQRSLYNPTGGQTGSLERERLFGEESRAKELRGTSEQQGLRNLYTMKRAQDASSMKLL